PTKRGGVSGATRHRPTRGASFRILRSGVAAHLQLFRQWPMPMLSGLEAVFAPRRVALVGASERPGTMGELFWRNLASFPGEVVPVTPSRRSLGGVKAYPSLASVDGEVDLAVVVV